VKSGKNISDVQRHKSGWKSGGRRVDLDTEGLFGAMEGGSLFQQEGYEEGAMPTPHKNEFFT